MAANLLLSYAHLKPLESTFSIKSVLFLPVKCHFCGVKSPVTLKKLFLSYSSLFFVLFC